jgi:hypothetical protein
MTPKDFRSPRISDYTHGQAELLGYTLAGINQLAIGIVIESMERLTAAEVRRRLGDQPSIEHVEASLEWAYRKQLIASFQSDGRLPLADRPPCTYSNLALFTFQPTTPALPPEGSVGGYGSLSY